ncbi:TSC22 domain family protein 1 isoform X2 [Eublepharis macularius]|uniref:TSC22 domain family protein 1 isoform X2 n=1 Tax=Eublepharis macularius TaxID=481883 RepID=A0AA97J0U0_EUBMA|nr:TSC22 domain family protein 1 isoform X2 [Eublepharis macularius]
MQQQQQQQQPDSAAAEAGPRKMAHPALLPRAGGGGGGGLEDPPAPGLGPPGAQLKKKSGFQITSVTPAQISASLSSNNSVAEDTESYDDLDESHTEDLSSSELLDASLSRATDLGAPERSSSEETLSNFQEADSPGALSPNQPRPPPHLNGAPLPTPPPPARAPPPPPPPRAPAKPPAGNGPAAAAAAPPPPAAATAAASRFRVVKLDSTSEPFKKGRWTCTEFYDKESPAPGPDGAALHKALEALRQAPPEAAAAAASERESTSGSSVSSGLSTLSHYTESVGSGEGGAQQAEFGGPGPQPLLAPAGLPQSASQPQLHHEAGYPPHKAGAPPPASSAGVALLPPAVSVVGGPPHPAIPAVGAPQKQPPYTQPAPALPQAHQLTYGPGQAQQFPVQMAPGHVKAANLNSLPGPDYVQHQQVFQAPAPSVQPSPVMAGTGAPVPAAQAPSMQSSGPAHLPVAPAQPVACVQTPMPAAGAGIPMMSAAQQGPVPPVVQQPLVANQMTSSVMPPNVAPSQAVPPVPTGVIPPGSQAGMSSLPQPLVIAPQTTLLPAQPLLQAGEPLAPGVAGQQVPAVSPGPAVGPVPLSGPSAANVPPPPGSLAPSKNIAPSSGAQNENVVQKVLQSSLTSTSISLSVPQNLPPLNCAQFSVQALAQSSASRGEEARRSTEPLLVGLESSAGVPSALLDGSGSMASSLFPLKALPLTAQLMDAPPPPASSPSTTRSSRPWTW